jgi:AcrR family transcriptional regulator
VENSIGRREEHKQRTRSALEQAAARLFEERGFAATTVRDIALAAGVGERTFFRYFPSKEDLVLQQARDLIPGLMNQVRARPAGEAPLVALRETIVTWLGETGTPPTILISGPPKGTEEHNRETHALMAYLEDAVTQAFLDRSEAAGQDPSAASTLLRAAVQARAGVAALRGIMIAYPGAQPDAVASGVAATAAVSNGTAGRAAGRLTGVAAPRPVDDGVCGGFAGTGAGRAPTIDEVTALVRAAFAALD